MAGLLKRSWLAALVLAAPVQAEGWFVHPFGELRAYHGDWLAVCDAGGAGPCRAVFVATDPGSGAYFDTRIAIHRLDNSPDWALEIMDRGLPAAGLTGMVVTIDGREIGVPLTALKPGELYVGGAADTVSVTDAGLALTLVEAMKAGNRMTVRYRPAGQGDGVARASLRGVTAAANAIEARVLARQE